MSAAAIVPYKLFAITGAGCVAWDICTTPPGNRSPCARFASYVISALFRSSNEARSPMIDCRLLIDRLQHGVVLFGERAFVMLVNRYAERILVRSRSVALRDHGLHCLDAFDDARLGQLLAGAERGRGGTLLVRSAGEPPLTLLAVPLASSSRFGRAGDTAEADDVAPRFAVVFSATNGASADTLDAFVSLYGLTPAERHVFAHLVRDRSPRDIAASSGVSVRTVRTQLSSIYSKAGVAGQRELLAQLLLFPPFAIG